MDIFCQVKDAARTLDKRLPELNKSVNERKQFDALAAMGKLRNLRHELNELKNAVEENLNTQTEFHKSFDETATLFKAMVENLQQNVDNTDQYLQKYGYKPSVQVKSKEVETAEETEESQGTEPNPEQQRQPDTPPQPKPQPNRMGTPQMEDFGLSEARLNTLFGLGGKWQQQQPANPQSIPSPFQHNGFLCTPSLFPSCKSMRDSHTLLASPVLSLVKPEENSDTADITESKIQPVTLGFDAESPKSQELKPQVTKTSTDIKVEINDETEGNETKPRGRYSYDEPQEPELTYSLEALQEMTGMFRIKPKEPEIRKPLVSVPLSENRQNRTPSEPELLTEKRTKIAPVSCTENQQRRTPTEPEFLTEKISRVAPVLHTEIKKHRTPTEPELLTEKIARLNQETAANPKSQVKPRLLYDDMPASPKLLMNYSSMKDTNTQ